MLPPLFNAVRTWKQEREMLSPPQMSQLPWEDVLAWPVPSAQLARQVTSLLSFFLLFLCLSQIFVAYIIAHSYCTAKQLPCSEQTTLPFLEDTSQLPLGEGCRPWASRIQNTPCFSALCGNQWLLSFICQLGASLLHSARCPSSALKVFMPRLTTPCTHCTWRWGTKPPVSIFFQETGAYRLGTLITKLQGFCFYFVTFLLLKLQHT